MRLFLRLQELRNPIETQARRLLRVLLLRLDRLSADPRSKPVLLLRVCPETLGRITEFSEHEAN